MDNNQCVEGILIDREHLFWKNGKSVHVQIRISVHDGPESVFTLGQNMQLPEAVIISTAADIFE